MRNKVRLDLRELQALPGESGVVVGPDDDRNLIVIAGFLRLVDFELVVTEQTGNFSGIDQSRMITDGINVKHTAFGRIELQEVRRGI